MSAAVEFWVMRVLGPVGKRVISAMHGGPAAVKLIADKLASGELAVIGGELCEPIEDYPDQERANARALECHRRTGEVHKVVMNADLDALA